MKHHSQTAAARKAQSERMRVYWAKKNAGKLAITKHTHKPVHAAETPATPLTPRPYRIPDEVRDIDSIFFRYRRLSEVGKAFVRKQMFTETLNSLPNLEHVAKALGKKD